LLETFLNVSYIVLNEISCFLGESQVFLTAKNACGFCVRFLINYSSFNPLDLR